MDPLNQLIEQENAKLRIVEAEAAAIRRRIQTLKEMQSGSDLDAFLAGRISTPAIVGVGAVGDTVAKAVAGLCLDVPKQPAGAGMVEAAQQRRKKGEVKRALLAIMDRVKPLHLTQLMEGMNAAGYTIDNKRMRAEMWAYKNDGLVESDQPGYFRLSDAGAAFLERQKGESPGGSGLSGATVSGSDLA